MIHLKKFVLWHTSVPQGAAGHLLIILLTLAPDTRHCWNNVNHICRNLRYTTMAPGDGDGEAEIEEQGDAGTDYRSCVDSGDEEDKVTIAPWRLLATLPPLLQEAGARELVFHPGRDMWVAVRVDRGEPAEEEADTSWVWEVRQSDL